MNSLQAKRATIGAATGVWAVGLASVGLLAYAMNRPIRIPAVAMFEPVRVVELSEPVEAVMDAPVPAEDAQLVLDPMWIFGETVQHAAASVLPAPPESEKDE